MKTASGSMSFDVCLLQWSWRSGETVLQRICTMNLGRRPFVDKPSIASLMLCVHSLCLISIMFDKPTFRFKTNPGRRPFVKSRLPLVTLMRCLCEFNARGINSISELIWPHGNTDQLTLFRSTISYH